MNDPTLQAAMARAADEMARARAILAAGEATIAHDGYAGYCGALEGSLELVCDALASAVTAAESLASARNTAQS